ncbi:MAG: hypothetical protein GY856_50335 [bacterium]|nr:hypothetical protein [bacterium]
MHARCILLIALIMTIATTAAATAVPVFDVPQIDGINVDGSGDDWAARGFRVELVTAPDGETRPADDFDVRFRVAWSREGLLVLATVRDDVAVEHENHSRLWRRDCVEIFVAEGAGGANRYQLVVASGADPEHTTVRHRLYDARPDGEGLPELSALPRETPEPCASTPKPACWPASTTGPSRTTGRPTGSGSPFASPSPRGRGRIASSSTSSGITSSWTTRSSPCLSAAWCSPMPSRNSSIHGCCRCWRTCRTSTGGTTSRVAMVACSTT